MYQGLQLVCAYFLAPFRILMVRDFWEGFFCHFSQFNPILFDKSSIAKINRLSTVNVVSVGSPSRIRIVGRISFGITTRPRSSILRTIPVAFIFYNHRFRFAKASFLCWEFLIFPDLRSQSRIL